jgi:hypothetical protein
MRKKTLSKDAVKGELMIMLQPRKLENVFENLNIALRVARPESDGYR